MIYLTLLVLFLCHTLADYTPLSTAWMLNAKRFGKPLLPILAHAAVHTLLMGIALILLGCEPYKIGCCMFLQLATHFGIDVLKGRINGWFPTVQNPANKIHWAVFGFDQYLHAVVIITMVYILFR